MASTFQCSRRPLVKSGNHCEWGFGRPGNGAPDSFLGAVEVVEQKQSVENGFALNERIASRPDLAGLLIVGSEFQKTSQILDGW